MDKENWLGKAMIAKKLADMYLSQALIPAYRQQMAEYHRCMRWDATNRGRELNAYYHLKQEEVYREEEMKYVLSHVPARSPSC